jgi:hypothetical protein
MAAGPGFSVTGNASGVQVTGGVASLILARRGFDSGEKPDTMQADLTR